MRFIAGDENGFLKSVKIAPGLSCPDGQSAPEPTVLLKPPPPAASDVPQSYAVNRLAIRNSSSHEHEQ